MFHKEGYVIILTSLTITIGVVLTAYFFVGNKFVARTLQILALVLLILILQFFRNPKRNTKLSDSHVVSPVDGKVVIIQEVYEKEYFKDHRIQVSVFMSPINVHVTRYPVGGKVIFSKYHPGDYLVAWHPKSSEKNERTTIVVKNKIYGEVLYRQIAGALARRIVNYAKVGQTVVQGTDAGFIKFRSRVDIFLPLNARIKVRTGQSVKGAEDIIAE